LFNKGGEKQSTCVSNMPTQAGIKTGSTTSNTGSINLLRHSFVDYKIGLLDKQDYSAEERIKLSKMMRDSIQTTPGYLSMVANDNVPLNAQHKRQLEKNTTESSANQEVQKAAPKAAPIAKNAGEK